MHLRDTDHDDDELSKKRVYKSLIVSYTNRSDASAANRPKCPIVFMLYCVLFSALFSFVATIF